MQEIKFYDRQFSRQNRFSSLKYLKLDVDEFCMKFSSDENVAGFTANTIMLKRVLDHIEGHVSN